MVKNDNLCWILGELSSTCLAIVILFAVVKMSVLFGMLQLGQDIIIVSVKEHNHKLVFCQPHFTALYVAHYP